MLPLDIYYAHLGILNGIKFTPREIDIIACLLNGRSAKTIPSLLSIAPKTAAAHIENIRSKTRCSSRESIIDFIEKSEKYILIKNEYYSNLLTLNSFEKCLREFSKIFSSKDTVCSVIYEQEDKIKCIRVPYLKQHLRLAGFTVNSKINNSQKIINEAIVKKDFQNKKYTLYILERLDQLQKVNINTKENNTFFQEPALSKEQTIILFFNKNDYDENSQILDNFRYVNFSEQKNYYFSFLKILHFLFPNKNIDNIFSDFIRKIEGVTPVKENSNALASSKNDLIQKQSFLRKVYSFLLPVVLLKNIIHLITGIVILLLMFYYYNEQNNKKTIIEESKYVKEVSPIRSDLVVPAAALLLNRSELLAQVDNKLKGEENLQNLALIGIGGAGKTTLARQYAQQQKAEVVWEINAETHEDLKASFEKLAAALSKTEEEQKELQNIKNLMDLQEGEEKLIRFIKTRLKALSSWFLIFDNVEALAKIQNYFPLDSQTWGKGKIILTARDHNLQNSNQINQVLFIGELNPSEKLRLFTKIMDSGGLKSFTIVQREEAIKFLEHIPPFPLDISVAAYYLRTTNSSYSEYLENLKKYKENFAEFQENMLTDHRNYNKTRYGIISLSLKKITEKSKDFFDLFLLISMINAQNIPKDLLEIYKDNITVSNFIYHLKKYSLILSDSFSLSKPFPALSLHHSVQDISLPYLVQQLKLSKGSSIIESIADTLDDYMDRLIENEEPLKLKMMVTHLEKFLDHSGFLTDLSKGLLKSKLARIYYFINEDRVRKTVEDSLEILKTQDINCLSPSNSSRLARSFLHLGAVYTELKHDKEAEGLFKKAISIYKHEKVKNYLGLSWALTYLGNGYRKLGYYEKAKDYLEASAQLNKQYDVNKERIARNLTYLGGVYRGLGLYQKAIASLEESLAFYKGNFSDSHYRIGWILIQLGNVHRDLGNSLQAKEYLEKGLFILKQHLHEKHVYILLVLNYLGNCYRELGNYEKSQSYLEQSLSAYEKSPWQSSLRRGWMMFNLASTYKSIGNIEKSKYYFYKVVEIYSLNCKEENILTARLLREMAGIFLEKNQLDEAEELIKKSLKILQSRAHIDTYKSLDILGEVYLKKSTQAFYANKIKESQKWKTQALDTFNQALNIANRHFPKNSIHIEKLSNKIKKLKNYNLIMKK